MTERGQNKHCFQNSKRYSEIAEFYKTDWRGEQAPDLIAKYESFLSRLDKNAKILDIGCGTGKASVYFAAKGYETFSLDLSYGMLNKTLKQQDEHCIVNGVLANMMHIPFPRASFDGIWSMAAIVHLNSDHRRSALKEFARILKPEAILFLSVQNKLNSKHMQRILQCYVSDIGYDENNTYYSRKKNVVDIMKGEDLFFRITKGYAYMDKRHWFFPTMRELKNELITSGFSVLNTNNIFDRRIDIMAAKK